MADATGKLISLCLNELLTCRCDILFAEHCKKPLDDYLATHFDGKVKVIHEDKREGAIRSRNTGAQLATGEVLVILDSHVEAMINWLPPLLGY